MSEPVQLAKAAREQLAAALNALQTSDVPDELVDAAEPIAQAMGVLHRIERTNGANLEGRSDALNFVRDGLDRVQKVDSAHPAVEKVMEAIAASLSKVHALARYVPPAAPSQPAAQPAPQPVAVAPAPQPVARPAPQPVPEFQDAPPTVPMVREPAPPAYAKPTPPVISPQYAQPSPAPAPQPAAPQHAAPQPAAPPHAAPPQVFKDPFNAAAAPPKPAKEAATTMASANVVPKPAPSQPGGASRIDVELGIHSASNFYKGLGGNDVIEHGGIFIATYKVLKRNTTVTLRVLLPGDYEFTASAVVQWTREGAGTEPGYGARFTQITSEGRQLVYRYTRNREPMFYDDL